MRIHYPHSFLGAPVLELSSETMASVFSEMDTVAEELRRDPMFVAGDLQIAFRQLQKLRKPNLSREDWLWLFDLWCDHDRGLQVVDDAKRAALWDALIDECELLFSTRERFPEHRAEMTARLLDIGRALAELQVRP
jgi:hypothetical protein